jgi:hypothetical protein
VRNALILLVVVAAVIVTAGAVNHSVAFDVDWVAGTLRAVSLFWVAAAIALLVVLAGLAAALLARRGAVRTQRKLEAELDVTYRRVRELEAAAPAFAAQTLSAATAAAPVAAAPTVAAPTVAAQTPATEPPAAAETTVTVVAAHGSARVTQVLPLPNEPAAGEPALVDPDADQSTAVEPEPHEPAVGDATAVTRAPGDAVGVSASDEPDIPAADAAGGEKAPPD